MRRLALLLLVALIGCDAITVVGTFDHTVLSINGTVSSVQLTNVTGSGGTLIVVTLVTLQQPGTFTTGTFCGNQVNLFPLSSPVRVDFRPGQPCATLVVVIVN